MPLIRFAAHSRFNVSAFVLTPAITLLLGLIAPQIAVAQRGATVHRPSGGGVPAYRPPAQIRPPSGGFNPRPRLPASSGVPARSAVRPSIPANRRPGRIVSTIHRSPHVVSVQRHSFNYYGPRYRLTGPGWHRYFPTGLVYYTHYQLKSVARATTPSVYYYYSDVFPAYIGVAYVIIQAPQIVYVDYPFDTTEGQTTDGQGLGDNDNGGHIRLTHAPGVCRQDLMLAGTLSDIETAWSQGDIRSLSKHVRQDAPVAVYLKDKYLYSLDNDSYLSMTRDAFSAIKTVSFALDHVQQHGMNIITVSGHHTYTSRHEEGDIHTVLVCYVLKRVNDRYFIVQVGTASEKGTNDDPNSAQNPQANGAGGNVRALAPPGIHAYPDDISVAKHRLNEAEWDDYFPSRSAYYPHYYLNYYAGVTTYSPYYGYEGAFPPYIGAASIINHPPQNAYVHLPLTTSTGSNQGVHSEDRDRKSAAAKIAATTAHDALLAQAIADINTAWSQKDSRYLSRHVHRDTPIAIFLKGAYAYSLDGGDYVSLTRDALSVRTPVSFTLDRVQREEWDIYSVSGHHTYTDKRGNSHEVQISYVLQKVDDDYYLIQVGTDP
jgi:hypothetical protein